MIPLFISQTRTLPAEIAGAYALCRRMTLRHAKTFYFASVFLPPHKRNACYAVYAFCRYIDDLVDSQPEGRGPREADRANEHIERVVEAWQAELDRVYAGHDAAEPVLVAWADTLRRFRIDRSLPNELVEGVLTDLRPSVRFETFEELRAYCYKVASVVGLMTTNIFGYSDPAALGHAVDLGIAMQLTNILRDINEDFANGRIYLPQEELEMFGVDERCIGSRSVSPAFRRMMQYQIERAEHYYDRAEAGIAMLDADSRLTVKLMSHNYRKILGVIERNRYDVFSTRASVPLHRKLMTVPGLWYTTRQ